MYLSKSNRHSCSNRCKTNLHDKKALKACYGCPRPTLTMHKDPVLQIPIKWVFLNDSYFHRLEQSFSVLGHGCNACRRTIGVSSPQSLRGVGVCDCVTHVTNQKILCRVMCRKDTAIQLCRNYAKITESDEYFPSLP